MFASEYLTLYFNSNEMLRKMFRTPFFDENEFILIELNVKENCFPF